MALCSLAVVELQHAAEPLTAPYRARSEYRGLRRDELVAQTLVRSFPVMIHERADGGPEVFSPRGAIRSKHSDLMDPTNRAAKAFKLGLRAGRSGGFTPLSCSRSGRCRYRAGLGSE